jgi:hypothetical protein
MHHKALAWAPYSKNALPLGLDLTYIGRYLLCGISLLVLFLVMEQDWLSSQKGFSIHGDKILGKSQNSRKSSRKNLSVGNALNPTNSFLGCDQIPTVRFARKKRLPAEGSVCAEQACTA